MKIRGKTVFVYDIEVFPNFFSITLKTPNLVIIDFCRFLKKEMICQI